MNEKRKIQSVEAGSISEHAGIEKGDTLVSINGKTIRDVFDYRFLTTTDSLLLTIEKPNGEQWEIDIEKEDAYEDLGLIFEYPLLDQKRPCENQCIFCFVDQLPKSMRKSLYFKDDDIRLSFLYGNYVTLSNCDDEELDRIIRYRLSPINVSVHTTNPELRLKMMQNENAGDIMPKIRKLVQNRITVNAQLVLCNGLNDGKYLDESLEDLTKHYPNLHSIAVVPAGLTDHRKGLYPLTQYDCVQAGRVVQSVHRMQAHCLALFGSRVVFAADEFYGLAKQPLPPYDSYESFPQLENGVGMSVLFEKQAVDALHALRMIPPDRTVSVATGEAMAPMMQRITQQIEKEFGIKVYVYPIKNRFFGPQVNVTGLLTGQDIKNGLDGVDLGECLYLSECMLDSDRRVFLDDWTIDDLRRELGVQVEIVQNTGDALVRKLIGVNL